MYDSQAEYSPAEEWDERRSTNEREWYAHQDAAYESQKQLEVDKEVFWDEFRESVGKVL